MIETLTMSNDTAGRSVATTQKGPVGLVAGHSALTPGVVIRRGPGRGSFREQEICREICDRMARHLSRRDVAVFDPKTDERALDYPAYLRERIEAMNAARVSAALELHLNASSEPGVNYVLCLHAPGSEPGRLLAEHVAKELAAAQRTDDDGMPDALVRPDTWLGAGQRKAFLRRTMMPAVIVEPAFLTHNAVRRRIERGRAQWTEMIAAACARGISAWLRSENA